MCDTGDEIIHSPTNKDKYECSICLTWLKIPVVTLCGHRFCRICITQWIEQSKSCPTCIDYLDARGIFPDNYTKREIAQKSIKCPNHLKGCKAELPIPDIEDHLNFCGFRCPQYYCEYYSVGCREKFYDDEEHFKHLDEYFNSHLKLFWGQMNEQGKTINTLSSKVTEQEKAVETFAAKQIEYDNTITKLLSKLRQQENTITSLAAKVKRQKETITSISLSERAQNNKIRNISTIVDLQTNNINRIDKKLGCHDTTIDTSSTVFNEDKRTADDQDVAISSVPTEEKEQNDNIAGIEDLLRKQCLGSNSSTLRVQDKTIDIQQDANCPLTEQEQDTATTTSSIVKEDERTNPTPVQDEAIAIFPLNIGPDATRDESISSKEAEEANGFADVYSTLLKENKLTADYFSFKTQRSDNATHFFSKVKGPKKSSSPLIPKKQNAPVSCVFPASKQRYTNCVSSTVSSCVFPASKQRYTNCVSSTVSPFTNLTLNLPDVPRRNQHSAPFSFTHKLFQSQLENVFGNVSSTPSTPKKTEDFFKYLHRIDAEKAQDTTPSPLKLQVQDFFSSLQPRSDSPFAQIPNQDEASSSSTVKEEEKST